MDKEILAEILQSCLLFNDGLSLEEIKGLMENPKNALIGARLCEFLESKLNEASGQRRRPEGLVVSGNSFY